MTRLVIFDCDGTLVDSEEAASRVFPAYWASHGVRVTETEFKEQFIGKGNQHPEVIALHERMPPHAMEEADRLWQDDLQRTLKAVSGIQDVLSSLDDALAVGSNSPLPHVKWALSKTGLAEYFGAHVFSASQVPRAKPEPDLFLYIAKSRGFRPEQCVVVEDSVSGVQAAKNAGMVVFGFTGASHFTPRLIERLSGARPDHMCSDARALKDALQKSAHAPTPCTDNI